MYEQIEAACRQFPKNVNGLLAAARRAGGVAAKAIAIGAFCRDNRIADFPNPYPGDTPEHHEWANAFGRQAQEPVIAEEAKADLSMLDQSVRKIKADVAAGNLDLAELSQLLNAENDGKTRAGVVDTLQKERARLSELV